MLLFFFYNMSVKTEIKSCFAGSPLRTSRRYTCDNSKKYPRTSMHAMAAVASRASPGSRTRLFRFSSNPRAGRFSFIMPSHYGGHSKIRVEHISGRDSSLSRTVVREYCRFKTLLSMERTSFKNQKRMYQRKPLRLCLHSTVCTRFKGHDRFVSLLII